MGLKQVNPLAMADIGLAQVNLLAIANMGLNQVNPLAMDNTDQVRGSLPALGNMALA